MFLEYLKGVKIQSDRKILDIFCGVNWLDYNFTLWLSIHQDFRSDGDGKWNRSAQVVGLVEIKSF